MGVGVHVYMHVTEKYQFYCLENTHNYSIYFFFQHSPISLIHLIVFDL